MATLFSAAALAQTAYVDDDNCPGPGTGTMGDPYCRIQTAICDLDAGSGGTVMVSPGYYNESLRMFPGVSVISTDGPAVTTIDADGKPCVTALCVDSMLNQTCSTVVWGTGSTTADRLEGFRIIGGAGLFRNFGGGTPPTALAGGGLFIFNSSPTITNNEIIDNNMFHANTTDYFWGGAIYMASSSSLTPVAPVITNNLIQENVADPPPGQNSNKRTVALGGGIYGGIFSAPILDSNTITSNRAGDTNKLHQVGGGGGISLYSTNALNVPVISNSLIVDNFSSDFGGGLAFGEFYSVSSWLPSQGLVENNIIELNRSFSGGGLNTGTTNVVVRNNSIVDNTAEFGGGLTAATSYNSTDNLTLVNNIVAFNTSVLYGAGGMGVYGSDPQTSYNDFYGDFPNEIDGDIDDADVIGLNNNISVDPLFVSRFPGARDLHLQDGSGAIDVGDNSQTPASDLDGVPRILDGNATGTAIVDLGAYEFQNDQDGDGTPDYLDDDDDGDGVLDVSDCAPFDAGVIQAPSPIGPTLRLDRGAGGTRLTWSKSLHGWTSNVYRGTTTGALTWSYSMICLDAENPGTQSNDPETPPEGMTFYYLVSAKNSCTESRAGIDRIAGMMTEIYASPACDGVGADRDGDGILDPADNCIDTPNPSQRNNDGDGLGDACDDDDDNDGELDGSDNCPDDPNPGLADADSDGLGDACDNCINTMNPGQVDTDSDGAGDDCDGDDDEDGIPDGSDNCPLDANNGQVDGDSDGPGDACDNCPVTPNTPQSDGDSDGIGDVCDSCMDDAGNDADSDALCADVDNCPSASNPMQEDVESDGVGDACDNCLNTANANQLDSDSDGVGDACDTCANDADDDIDSDGLCADVDNCPVDSNAGQVDGDSDGVGDDCDNCPATANGNQADQDSDGIGDVCDTCPDADADGDCDGFDNCVDDPNPLQEDADSDGSGDACDICTDIDGDLFGDGSLPANACGVDNCLTISNPSQVDLDGDGAGDPCDACPLDADDDGDSDGHCADVDNCPTTANASQSDGDTDGVGDPCDNCSGSSNANQADADQDGLGDVCDTCPNDAANDADTDGVCGDLDNCPTMPNTPQADGDSDGVGDVCDNCSAVANANQDDTDSNGTGDACDTCTDTDSDGFGDPGFPATTCMLDNCPSMANAGQGDMDSDGLGDACDACPNDAGNDADTDSVCDDIDNCLGLANPDQANIDSDGLGDACDDDIDGDTVLNGSDNCPTAANMGQADVDTDGVGDACDNCASQANQFQEDGDSDGAGDICDGCPGDADDDIDSDGFCADFDNCPTIPNPGQEDADNDARGNVCDPCPTDQDLDGDDVCNADQVLLEYQVPSETVLIEFSGAIETVLVEQGSAMTYKANDVDPMIPGVDWAAETFDDSGWTAGVYGVGYEVVAGGAGDLITTTVDTDTYSVYTRATFNIADVGAVGNLFIGADYDDGYIAWINGVEVFRSAEMPGGTPAWDTNATNHESSNGSAPDYRPLQDISTTGIGALHNGVNVLAIGVWNNGAPVSSDMVLVPKLSMNRVLTSDMDYLANNSNPGIAMTWTDPMFDASSWTAGSYGIGYELTTGAENLIQTTVPSDTLSVYTRAEFTITDVLTVQNVFLGADYDDGFIAWINGVEVYRSPEMPGGTPIWNSNPLPHESSNGAIPVYLPDIDITSVAKPLLVNGTNLLAVGLWNTQPSSPPSSDMVIVPKLSINRVTATPVAYLDNNTDPGIGMNWTDPLFDDSSWPVGAYGIGYETGSTGARNLIQTSVAVGTYSVYTRAQFQIIDLGSINNVYLGADYDDGFAAWINGVEVYRSPEVPFGSLEWDTPVNLHESSNGALPNYQPLRDITFVALPVLVQGQNDLAIGVWNAGAPNSSDLLIVPRLSVDGASVDNCPNAYNPDQLDTDGDSMGDVCDQDDDNDLFGDFMDNCPLVANMSQLDQDSDGLGDVCDNCVNAANVSQSDLDSDGMGDACDICPNDPVNDIDTDGVCGDVDNCPATPNGSQTASDSDGLGDACDNCPLVFNPSQIDDDSDGMGNLCDTCPLDPANDVDSDSHCGDVDNCPVTPNPTQADGDSDGAGDDCDCRPADPLVSIVPPEITDLGLLKMPQTQLSWGSLGVTEVYDVVSGSLSDLLNQGGAMGATCAVDDVAGTNWSDMQADPASGAAYYYLLRGQNVCGSGSYGYPSSGPERVPSSGCP